ncbi:hypothetical protein F4777DRAFT_538377 [Nemania sp. FL0916]|nr:hypothetical protein F4777DRAFT_538377 [Nemania sp. FL0916]
MRSVLVSTIMTLPPLNANLRRIHHSHSFNFRNSLSKSYRNTAVTLNVQDCWLLAGSGSGTGFGCRACGAHPRNT